jgi:hypothetical protein
VEVNLKEFCVRAGTDSGSLAYRYCLKKLEMSKTRDASARDSGR